MFICTAIYVNYYVWWVRWRGKILDSLFDCFLGGSMKNIEKSDNIVEENNKIESKKVDNSEKKLVNKTEEENSSYTETPTLVKVEKRNSEDEENTKLIPVPLFILMNIGNALLKSVLWILDLLMSMVLSLGHFFKMIGVGAYKGTIGIYKFFRNKVIQFKENDLSGRLSYVCFGASSFKHKQYANGVLFVLFEVGYIIFMICGGAKNIAMLKTLGDVLPGPDPSCEEMICDWIEGDNSVMVLVFGLLSLLSIVLFAYIWNRSINSGYNNYRIVNYIKYKEIIDRNVEFSNTLDKQVDEAVKEGIKKSVFKKSHNVDLENRLNEIKDNSKFEIDFVNIAYLETIADSYEHFKLLAKENKKLEKLKNKEEELLKVRKDKKESLNIEAGSIEEIRFNQITDEKDRVLVRKIKAQENKIRELSKRHASYVGKESIINDSKYGKFNIFYKVRAEKTNEINFYKNYARLVEVYENSKGNYLNTNKENLARKNSMKDELEAKIKEINSKFDAIVNKKKSLIEEMNKYTELQKQEIKEAKVHAKKNGQDPKQIELDIKAKYFGKISYLAGEIHNLPADKSILAMRKEEIKEVEHSYARDRKYLKTNFTELSFARESVVNYMVVEYNFEHKFAEKMLGNIDIVDKKTKEHSHLSEAEVEDKIKTISKELDDFVEANPNKFVGKPKSFKEQIASLMNENFHISILALPVTGVVLFVVIPLLFSIIVAFTNYSFGHVPPTELFTWNGIQNFITLFNAAPDSAYAALPSAVAKTIGWTICWTIIATFSNYFLGIILALLINKKDIKLKKLWRTIFIMTIAVPQFISLLSMGVLLKDTGAIGSWWVNTFGTKLGFATDTSNGALTSKIIIILVNIWVGIPYTMLSTTGILMNIPNDLYESARVDGASAVTQFTKITLPYILFVTGPHLISQFVGNVNNFNVIYFLTGGAPSISGSPLPVGNTDLLITFIYKIVTSNNNPQFGIASAIGIVVFVICAFFSIIMYNKSGSIKSEDQFQ